VKFSTIFAAIFKEDESVETYSGDWKDVLASCTKSKGRPHVVCVLPVEQTLVAGQRPQKKQRIQPLLCNRSINNQLFLSNSSLNIFLQKQTHATTEELCFRCGLYQGVSLKTIKLTSSVINCQLSSAREAEVSPLLEAVARKWPVRTEKTHHVLVICIKCGDWQ
jgi:hypothetical protein